MKVIGEIVRRLMNVKVQVELAKIKIHSKWVKLMVEEQ